jgi:hypothetical protein
MTTPTIEIIDLKGATTYLDALVGNISYTTDVEFETVLAGFARVELTDDEVLTPLGTARDSLTAARVAVEEALERLRTAHGAVAETVAAAGGPDAIARDALFYGEGA